MNNTVAELVRRVQAGEYTLFNDVYQMTYADTLATVERALGQRELAENVVRESYNRAYNQILTLYPPERFEEWLIEIASRTMQEMYGVSMQLNPTEPESTDPGMNPAPKKKKVPVLPIILGAAGGGLLLLVAVVILLWKLISNGVIPGIMPKNPTEVSEGQSEGEEPGDIDGLTSGINWSIDSGNVLHIQGNGKMENYTSSEDTPWAENAKTIQKIQIDKGVKSVGDMAFEYCEDVSEVSLPDGLESIGKEAFWGLGKLKEIHIPSSVKNIGENAFKFSGVERIYGALGSYAETYALENGFEFVPGDTLVAVEGDEPEEEPTVAADAFTAEEQMNILNEFGSSLAKGQNLFYNVDFNYVTPNAVPVNRATEGILAYQVLNVDGGVKLLVLRMSAGSMHTYIDNIQYQNLEAEMYAVDADGDVAFLDSTMLLDDFYIDNYYAGVFYKQTSERLLLGIEVNGFFDLTADGINNHLVTYEFKNNQFSVYGEAYMAGSYYETEDVEGYFDDVRTAGIDTSENGPDLVYYEDERLTALKDPTVYRIASISYMHSYDMIEELHNPDAREENPYYGHCYGYSDDVHFDIDCVPGEVIKSGTIRTISYVNDERDIGDLTGLEAKLVGYEWKGSSDSNTRIFFRNDHTLVYRELSHPNKWYIRTGNYGTWYVENNVLHINVNTSKYWKLLAELDDELSPWEIVLDKDDPAYESWEVESFTKVTK